ncbi:DivIVA domain-containing protein [Aquipuribacter sp. MA13-6]|uniref:DivIVA domain-containing protein n=1 Tax=unclassified Aquipuribacter TaxID=2635084 RepID=UPI003EEDD6EF
MDLLLIALLLAAVGAVVVVALGKVGGGLAPVQPDAAPALDEPLSRPGDLDRARFTLAVRGYRMDQVDAVLDEARDLLVARDDEIARLHQLLPAEPQPAAAHQPADSREALEPEQPVRREQPVGREQPGGREQPVEADPFQRRDTRS